MLQLFPTTVIGLDLSDHSIEAVSLRRVFGRTVLRAFGRTTIAPGIVEDGLIRDVGAVAEAIRRCLTQATPQPIQARLCVITLAESRVFIRRVQVPAVLSPIQVRSSILNEVERHLPISLSDCYFDYLVVSSTPQVRTVLFAATEKSVVHAYVDALRRVGLTPVAFDLESTSQYRALVHRPLLGAAPPVAIVDFGARTTNVSIFSAGALLGSLTIPIAGNHLSQALVDEVHLLPAEAESAKRQAGLLTTGSANRISPILIKTLHPLVDQLRHYVQYWQQSAGITVSKLVLAGGTARLPGLSEHLRAALGVPVELPNPFQRVITPRHVVSGRQTILYADVIGAGLRALANHPDRAGLNLLSMAKDRSHREKAERFFHLPKWDHKLIALVLTLVGAGVLLGVLLWWRLTPSSLRQPGGDAGTVRTYPIAVTYASTETSGDDVLRGRLVRVRLPVSTTGTPTGAVTGATAVTLVNETDVDRPLVADTRLASDDGRIWRLSEDVTVPALGEIVVSLQEADEDPPAGRLSIPGLSPAVRARVYARVAASEGSPNERSVTAQDVAEAAQAATATLQAAALAELVVAQAEGEWVLPVVIGQDTTGVSSQPPVGGVASIFTLQGDAVLLGLALDRAELVSKLGSGVDMADIVWADLSFTLESVDLDRQVVRGILTVPMPVENSSTASPEAETNN